MRRFCSLCTISLLILFMVACGREQGQQVRFANASGRFQIATTGEPYTVKYGENGRPLSGHWPVYAAAVSKTGEPVSLRLEQPGADRKFRVLGIPLSARKLEFHSNQTLKTIVPFDGTIASTPKEVELGDVILDFGYSIHVSVLSPDGRPVKRADLRLTSKGKESIDRADTTDEFGHYTFRGFPPGSAQLTVHADRNRGNAWVNNRDYSVDGTRDVMIVDLKIEDVPVTDIEVQFPRR
jgi:hypothetical protein